jgi:cytochrome c oxidase subunit 1
MATSGIRAPATTTRPARRGHILASWLSSTDHKVIGYLYLITSFGFFLFGGVLALIMRAQLARPGQHLVSNEQYNQLFTMHGTIMLLLFATPLFIGFGNVVMPLQIGAPDVAFPRLNMLSYFFFTFGGLITISGFLTPDGAASFGWFAYTPLSDVVRSPGVGGDLWIMGLALSGLGTILGAVNFVTTIFCMRAPGMTMFRMPIFTWNVLLTSMMVLMAFPVLAAALFVLEADRKLGAHVFDTANGGPMLWQHLFWFFGHPEVYIIAIPFFGIITEVIPVFSRKPLFGYVGMIGATTGIAGLSMTVWAHHMFATGQVLLPFFSFMSYLIAIPTGIKFFNWVGTMWRGHLTFEPPMLFAVGRDPRLTPAGLPRHRLLLRRRPLPLRRLRHRRVRDVRRLLLLVAEDDREDPQPDLGETPLLAHLHRLPDHLPRPALARRRRHATPHPRLRPQIRHPQPRLFHWLSHPRLVHPRIHLERLHQPPRSAGHRR